MYVPAHFKNQNIEEVKSFIEQNSFAILVTHGESKMIASHIPLELAKNEMGEDILQGHISKGNQQWKSFGDKEVLAIFSGPNSYISSSWYNHENVPTWNYIAVHVNGTIRIVEGKELIDALIRLTDKYEKNSEEPVTVNKMSVDFLNREIKGIVGFEIKITSIEAAYKLSQNRDAVNKESIVKALEKNGDPGALGIAKEIKKGI